MALLQGLQGATMLGSTMSAGACPLWSQAGPAAQANKIYRWRIVQASISKWMDLSLHRPGCQLGLYARDGNFLRALPRSVTNLMAAATNRLELLAVCQPGLYQLR